MDVSELTRRVFGEPEGDPDAIERAGARLMDAIREDQTRRRRKRRFVLPAAATVAIAAAASVVVALIGPIGGSTAAAVELRRLGAIASSAESPDVGEGEYLLVVSDELRRESQEDLNAGSSFTVLARLRLRTWIAMNGSSFRRTEVTSSRFASEADRRVWEEAGRPVVPHAGDVRDERSRSDGFFWVDLRGLPQDPARLLAELRSGSIVPRSPGDDEVFLLIGELLAQGDASPELRAALFEAASQLQGIEEAGEVIDPLGRDGIALTVESASLRTRLVFDPGTADLLAIELSTLGADGAVGPLMSWRAFHRATVVDSSPEA